MSSEQAIESTEDDERPVETTTGVDEAEDDEQPIEIEHAPPRITQVVAGVAALIGTLLTAPFVPLAIPFGLAGLVIVAGSLFVMYSIGWLTIGTGMILLAALISGAYGALSPELMLVAVGATIVAWDAGQHGIVIGEQLGRQTRSQRNQIVHIAASSLVIALVSAFVYFVYLLGGDGRPAPAVAIVVVGVLIMAWVYRS